MFNFNFKEKTEFSNQKKRFIQFLKIFTSTTNILGLQDLGRNTSVVLMMKEALFPLDNSTDAFINIVLKMYITNGKESTSDILEMASTLESSNYHSAVSSISYGVLEDIESLCQRVLVNVVAETRVSPVKVTREPIELLKGFKNHISELLKQNLNSNFPIIRNCTHWFKRILYCREGIRTTILLGPF